MTDERDYTLEHACLTGDCPHGHVHECAEELGNTYVELRKDLARQDEKIREWEAIGELVKVMIRAGDITNWTHLNQLVEKAGKHESVYGTS